MDRQQESRYVSQVAGAYRPRAEISRGENAPEIYMKDNATEIGVAVR